MLLPAHEIEAWLRLLFKMPIPAIRKTTRTAIIFSGQTMLLYDYSLHNTINIMLLLGALIG
jgi:hypothetical protein